MPEKTRVEEAERNINNYLAENLLIKISTIDKKILSILIKNSNESINVAEILFEKKYSDLWTIVTAYYSMYYIAKACLYKKGYSVEHKISHKVTSDALIVYIRRDLKDSLIKDYENAKKDALEIAGLKADELIYSFELERNKRSRFQYDSNEIVIRSKAKTSLERAKQFVFEMNKLIDKI